MKIAPALQSLSFTPLSCFGRFVCFARNLPTYAQKTVKLFDAWYLAQDRHFMAFFPASLGIFGHTYQIPLLETVASLGFSYLHYLNIRYILNGRISLAEEAAQETKALAAHNPIPLSQALDVSGALPKKRKALLSPSLEGLDLASKNVLSAEVKQKINSLIEKGNGLKGSHSCAGDAVKILKKWKSEGRISKSQKVSSLFEEIRDSLEFSRNLNAFGIPFWVCGGFRLVLKGMMPYLFWSK